jgi:hypothetical protein
VVPPSTDTNVRIVTPDSDGAAPDAHFTAAGHVAAPVTDVRMIVSEHAVLFVNPVSV